MPQVLSTILVTLLVAVLFATFIAGLVFKVLQILRLQKTPITCPKCHYELTTQHKTTKSQKGGEK